MPLHRRDFGLGILKISAAALLSPRLLSANLPGNDNDDVPIATRYQKAVVIDSLCAPFVDMDTSPSAETLAAVRRSGITAVNFTVSDPTFEGTGPIWVP